MPYSLTVPPSWKPALEEMAELLGQPRRLLGEVEDRFRWIPAEGSLAESDLGTTMELRGRPRENASMYLRVGSDHLAGVAALFRATELLFSPAALCRVTFEHVVRAVLALDPGVTAEERIARAVLDDVVSAYFSRLAVKELVEGDKQTAAFRQADARWRAIKEAAEASFAASWAGNAPYDWEVGGHRYLRIDAPAVEEWRRLRAAVPAVGFYAALSLYTHPQSLPEELHADEGTRGTGPYDRPRLRRDVRNERARLLGRRGARPLLRIPRLGGTGTRRDRRRGEVVPATGGARRLKKRSGRRVVDPGEAKIAAIARGGDPLGRLRIVQREPFSTVSGDKSVSVLCPSRRDMRLRGKHKPPVLQRFLGSPLTDSNRRPPPYHGGALPTELRGRVASVALVRRSGSAACQAACRLEWSLVSAGPHSGDRPRVRGRSQKGIACTYGWRGTRLVGTSTSSSRAPRTGCSRSSRVSPASRRTRLRLAGTRSSRSASGTARRKREDANAAAAGWVAENMSEITLTETNFGELMLSTTLGVSPARA